MATAEITRLSDAVVLAVADIEQDNSGIEMMIPENLGEELQLAYDSFRGTLSNMFKEYGFRNQGIEDPSGVEFARLNLRIWGRLMVRGYNLGLESIDDNKEGEK